MKDKLASIVASGNNLIGGLLHNIDKKTLMIQNERLKDLNLTFVQAMAIIHIYYYREHDFFQKDLEKNLGLTNPTVTSLVKTMMAKDLLYRIQSKRDGRYFSLHLTAKSLAMVENIVTCIYQADQDLYSCLSVEETKTLQTLLTKIYNASLEMETTHSQF